MSSEVPAEAPPPYSREPIRNPNAADASSYPHATRNGIPPARRRSMEDEARPLPEGWVRQYDQEQGHQYFVDTRADPPRSIWQHPYDDEQFLASLPSDEHERIQSLHRVPTDADIVAEDTDDEDAAHAATKGKAGASAGLPPRPAAKDNIGSVHRFGRKMKDKMTSSTHEDREIERNKRAEAERKAYEAHQVFRRALTRAIQTGEPQLVGKDRQGKEVYVQPPTSMGAYGSRGGMYGQGIYASPNARYMRPSDPYRRPYGYGYGGGYGLPLAGGLAGGMLLGSAMGGGLGGFGGGFGGMGGMGGMGMGMGGMGMGGGMGGGGC